MITSSKTYVPQDERLRWAFGCFLAAIKQRFAPMYTGNYRVSRGVMLVEAVEAFGPLTLGWFEIVLGGSGIVRLTDNIVDRNFLAVPGGTVEGTLRRQPDALRHTRISSLTNTRVAD